MAVRDRGADWPGVLLAAGGALAFGGYTVERLAVVVLVLGGVALVFGGAVITLTAMSTAAPVLAVRRALRSVESGDYDVDVPVFDTTELGLLQAGFNTMVAGLRERERVRDLFGRQVGEDVARNAMENELELGGEVREVAVLFIDLVGSTTLAATRPPTEVVEVLNQFFALVIDVVENHGGWINKFEGDAALAVFGVPTGLRRRGRLRAGRGPGACGAADAGGVRGLGPRGAGRHRDLGGRGGGRQHRRPAPLRVHGDRRPGERGRTAVRGGQGDRLRGGRVGGGADAGVRDGGRAVDEHRRARSCGAGPRRPRCWCRVVRNRPTTSAPPRPMRARMLCSPPSRQLWTEGAR